MECHVCGKEFKRKGHLTRHLTKHSKAKPFDCSFCDRQFSRRDSLFRHAALHGQDAQSRRHQTPAEMPRRCQQACFECARSKQRCQGGTPCWRCVNKGLFCSERRQNPDAEARGDSDTSEPPVGECQGEDILCVDDMPQEFATDQFGGLCTIWPPTEEASETPFGDESVALDAPSLSARSPPQELVEATSGLDLLVEPYEPGRSLIIDPEHQDPDVVELDLQLYDTLDGTDCTSSTRVEESVDMFPWPSIDFSFHPTFCFPVDDFLGFWQNIAPKENQELGTQSSSDESGPETQIPQATKPTLRLAFPPRRPTDDSIIQSEDFGHVREVDEREYRAIRDVWDSQKGGFQQHGFPRREVINAFVQLYFEHFDSQFPCVHHSQVQVGERSWILLLALAATGSQYSEISCAFGYASALQELLRLALKANPPTSKASVTVSYVQSILLRDIYCAFSGSERNVFAWQCERSNLVFLCQTLLSIVSKRSHHEASGDVDPRWREWVTLETHHRVVQCAYLLDSLALIFCNHQPVFQLSHLPGTEPCGDVLWRCQTAETWRRQMDETESAPQQTGDRNDTCRQFDGFASSLKLAVAFMQERQLLFAMNGSNCQLETFATSRADGAHLRPFKSYPEQFSNNPKIRRLNEEIESMAEPLTCSGSREEMDYYNKTTSLLFHVASIFRLIPFRTLVRLSGWESSAVEMESAAADLKDWILGDPESSRRCLWHAANIFGRLRSTRHFACIDPLALFVAVVYTDLYDRSKTRTDSLTGLCDVGKACGQPPLRLDRSRDAQALRHWIKHAEPVRVHITGVGILRGQVSSLRLMAETQKILESSSAWRDMCQGIARAADRLSNGKWPVFCD